MIELSSCYIQWKHFYFGSSGETNQEENIYFAVWTLKLSFLYRTIYTDGDIP